MIHKILVVGSSNTDMTVKTAKLPVPGETVLGGEFTMGGGGKGANQAVAAQRLGGDVSFFCKVGKDIFGDNALKSYEQEGMDISLAKRSDKPSGVALISVDSNAENCIVVASGANSDVRPEDIESIRDALEGAEIVLLQLETPVPAVMKAAEIAHAAGATVVLNPAPACDLPEELFRHITLFIPNETELSRFSGIKVEDADSAAKAAGAMKAKGVKDIIVTMGSKGSLIVTGDGCKTVEACKVKAIDTTAAGDTYCGALCVALSEGRTLEEAAVFATKASALTVQRMGAQASIPYRKEIENQ
ncbi:MAG: ribokinase [Bacteroidales bacterium]|nr:ribokinase [Bacteroidales bacterium]